ncbi:hypothetical protein GCM10027293_31890 [Pontibacter aydingkolensis]
MLTLVSFILFPISKSFAQSYSAPIIITKGGTYTGNWESRDSEVPAVEIRTTEPVVIENSNIRGAGYLIKSWGYAVNLTVRHTKGYGIQQTPYVNYKKPRRFVTVNNFTNLVVENCYMESTAGIYTGTRYEGNGSPSNTIKVRYNIVKNIDGRVYGGAKEHSQFMQFNFKNAIAHAEVAWNQVINEAGNSLVEDNINIYNTKGTPSSPIKIHNNYIQGAYPAPHTGTSFSGGGIITDGDGDISTCPAYVEAHDNQLVNLGNYSMGIAGGNNIRYHHNRAVSSAKFKDGTKFGMYSGGLWSKDYYKKNTTFANSIDNNVVGITAWGGYPSDRNDITVQEHASFTNNTHIPGGAITQAMEAEEFIRWTLKLQQNGIVLGPNGSSSAAPAPNQAPIVALTSPTSGASFASGNPITLSANATDVDGKVTKVEYFSGSIKLGEAVTAPYAFNWANATAGTYNLTAKATDDKNATKVSAAVSVTVTASIAQTPTQNQVPSITITSPKASATFTAGNAITITADASDTDGKISKVEFFSGTTKLGETTTAPYTYSWTNATAGSYSLTAKATDDKGATKASAAVAITVAAGPTAGTTPPTTGTTPPTSGTNPPTTGTTPPTTGTTPPATGTTPPSGGSTTADLDYQSRTAYPNPFNDIIVLDLTAKKVDLQRVVLKNQTGKIVYEEKGSLALVNDKLEINLSDTKLKSGLYYVMFTDTTGTTESIKVIKE